MNYAEGKTFTEQISGVIIFTMMPMMCLRGAFLVHTRREFWPSLAHHSVEGAALLLFISVFFLLFSNARKRTPELIRRDEQTRRALGNKAILKVLIRLYYPASCAGLFFDFLRRTPASPLTLGHYLVAASVSATLAMLAHLAAMSYSDCLAEDPPRPNISATQQLRWLFKGNKS